MTYRCPDCDSVASLFGGHPGYPVGEHPFLNQSSSTERNKNVDKGNNDNVDDNNGSENMALVDESNSGESGSSSEDLRASNAKASE